MNSINNRKGKKKIKLSEITEAQKDLFELVVAEMKLLK